MPDFNHLIIFRVTMKNKTLTSVFLSSLFLTACGGGGDNANNGNSFQAKEKLDYSKPENLELIYAPIINLSSINENQLIDTITLAESVFYLIQGGEKMGYKAFCRNKEGSFSRNSQTVTLNKCDLQYTKDGVIQPVSEEPMILSGSVSTQGYWSQDNFKIDTILNQFKVEVDNEITTFNGSKSSLSYYADARPFKYDIAQMEFTWADKKYTEVYKLTNYSFEPWSTGSITKGRLVGISNNKEFSVNFDNQIKFGSVGDVSVFYPSFAEIFIEDTNNNKNAITITKTVDYKALMRAYANGVTVTGFPKVVAWEELNY
ncbi:MULTISPECIES: hypothetical protein [unclassified Acinetobacter]|uniref:hypothetical protein n=2 Tax=Moraxellaceae TaxID=468 RepID=UPI001D0D352D|nr:MULTISPECIES: hypothetical protein [unclassified Acinetobacter]MCJ0828746.1 hypothetical protein [Acinetobacter sp. NIPH1876]